MSAEFYKSLSLSVSVQNWSHNKLDISYQNPRRETWGKSRCKVECARSWHVELVERGHDGEWPRTMLSRPLVCHSVCLVCLSVRVSTVACIEWWTRLEGPLTMWSWPYFLKLINSYEFKFLFTSCAFPIGQSVLKRNLIGSSKSNRKLINFLSNELINQGW
jgi:hypothetical protein